ncbi:MAG: hypothetical protein JOZ78_02785 [Chroococcidiopsidaceae cyanobacterium CP_BM_ER_R8_30]|nr:hypothetical protein [Chroococcidiopsidaceae cyanobacterium CP_BM_ER_R8_30]
MAANLSGYRSQSEDTTPEIDRFLMLAFRQMPIWKKVHLTNEATKGLQQWALIGIRNQYPDANPAEVRFHLAVRWLGKEIAQQLYRDGEGKIVEAESISLALRMAEILDALGIPYLIGGSVASSILGEPRATLDVDIVADLQLSHVQPLVSVMTGEFFIDEMMVVEAIEHKSSFNVIHLDTMQKVDIFILSDQPLAQSEMQRRQQLVINQRSAGAASGSAPVSAQNPERLIWLSSPEDIILQKLLWYRLGHQVSDRQWRDVLGVLKVQATLDFGYLAQWSETLGLENLMAQALREAGHSESR